MSLKTLYRHPDKKHPYYEVESHAGFTLCQCGGSLSSIRSYDSFAVAELDGWKKQTDFVAWVVLDEYNKAICYLDESLGDSLEMSKDYHERQGYRIIPLTGEICQ